MKNKFLTAKLWSFALILFAFVFTSCGDDDNGTDEIEVIEEEVVDPATASFTASAMFLEISTTNTSENAVSYAWDFGDGTGTSTDFEPTYTYAEAGTFTITLVTTGADDSTDTATMSISIMEDMIVPSSAFISEADLLMVNFTNISENAVSFAWDFGDNTGTSTEENPSYTYSEAGTFMVTLTTTSSTGNTAESTSPITVAAAVAPMADFTFVVADLEVTFTDASVANDGTITAYAWDFGDGVGTSTEQSPVYTYADAGDFDVVLTITFDDVNGETMATTMQTVTAIAASALVVPVPGFTFAATDLEVTFTDTTVANDGTNITYAWDFGDGAGTSTDQSPVYTYADAGSFDVTLDITFDDIDGVTTATISQMVTVTAAAAGTGPGTPGNQFAMITDTSADDTGELRLDLGASYAMGMMTVTVSKEMTQDGFINLSGTSTTRRNAMIDLRINDGNGYEFTESGDTVNATANFPSFVNDQFVDMIITWDATGAGAPLVTYSIDGQAVTMNPFPTESQDLDAVQEGVRNIQFRLGGGSALDDTGASFFVDDVRIYDTSTGTPTLVFGDDFEGYTAGLLLNPDNTTPYHPNSFQATVGVE